MTTPAKEPAPNNSMAKRFHSSRRTSRLLLNRAAIAICRLVHLLSNSLTVCVKMSIFMKSYLGSCYPKLGFGLADMTAKDNFARNLALRMTGLGISDSDLARKLECAPTTVGRWKKLKSEPSFDDLDRVAKILGVTPADLLMPTSSGVEQLDTDAALAILTAAIRREKSPVK